MIRNVDRTLVDPATLHRPRGISVVSLETGKEDIDDGVVVITFHAAALMTDEPCTFNLACELPDLVRLARGLMEGMDYLTADGVGESEQEPT